VEKAPANHIINIENRTNKYLDLPTSFEKRNITAHIHHNKNKFEISHIKITGIEVSICNIKYFHQVGTFL